MNSFLSSGANCIHGLGGGGVVDTPKLSSIKSSNFLVPLTFIHKHNQENFKKVKKKKKTE